MAGTKMSNMTGTKISNFWQLAKIVRERQSGQVLVVGRYSVCLRVTQFTCFTSTSTNPDTEAEWVWRWRGPVLSLLALLVQKYKS